MLGMHSSTAVAFVSALLLSSVRAQTATSSAAVTHTIDVGKGGFTISPDSVRAAVGDQIDFVFWPTNHSIVRSWYGQPCQPYEDYSGVNKPGFFSGFRLVDTGTTSTFTVTVNDTDPIFYYCSKITSCINHGMIGVINSNGTESLQAQKQFATQPNVILLQPGQEPPSEYDASASTSASPSTTTTHTSTTMSTTTSTTSSPSSATTSAAASSSKSPVMSQGAIVGVAIGGAALLIIAALAFWLVNRHYKRRNQQIMDLHTPGMSTGHGTPAMVQNDAFYPKYHTGSPPPQAMYPSPAPLYTMGAVPGQHASYHSNYDPQSAAQEQRRFSMSPTPDNMQAGPYAPQPQSPSQVPRIFEIHSSMIQDRSPRRETHDVNTSETHGTRSNVSS